MKRSSAQFRNAIVETIGKAYFEQRPAWQEYQRHFLKPEGARVFAWEHTVFTDEFPHWFGNIVGNCPHLAVRQYLVENMYVEEVKDPTIPVGHHESMVDFAEALGLPRQEVMRYGGQIHTRMALNYWDNATRTKPWLEAFAAVGGLELTNSAEVRKALGAPPTTSKVWAPLGLSGKAMAHFEAGEAADAYEGGHGEETMDILIEYADTEAAQDAVLRTLEESLRVLAFQMDCIGWGAFEASGLWPLPAGVPRRAGYLMEGWRDKGRRERVPLNGRSKKRAPQAFREELVQAVGRAFLEHPPAIFDFVFNHVNREGAKFFAREHCVFADEFPHWFGNLVGNCPVFPVRQYMIENMYVEEVKDPTIDEGHYESMVNFATALGWRREDIVGYKGQLHTRLALSYWDNVSRTKPWLEAFAAVGGSELANNAEVARRYGLRPINSADVWAPLGLKGKSMAHWEAGEAADTHEGGHGDETLNLLVRYADTAQKQDAVRAALEESLRVLNFQMDLLGKAAFEHSAVKPGAR